MRIALYARVSKDESEKVIIKDEAIKKIILQNMGAKE
jgi:DNA invertase Pin-like site-specific DNA recombinase